MMEITAPRIVIFVRIGLIVPDIKKMTRMRMRIELSNNIKIENPPGWLLTWCKGNLVLPNPDYYKKQSMGKWVGNISKDIFLYERVANTLILPFGVWNRNFYDKVKTDAESIESDIKPFKAIEYKSNINLYNYQEKAVKEALNARNGIIVMPCGAGKTQTAIELIARLGGRTLWLTHTQDLLNQSMSRAKACLDVDNETYGKITAGKVDIGTGITFATVQTMAKIDLEKYKYEWDVIVVDECHKAVGSPTKVMQFYKVVSSLACRYKFGLTATPKRSDGLTKSMLALLGEIIIEIPKAAVADTTCPVKVQAIHTKYMPDCDAITNDDGTINYSFLIDDLIHNKERFEFVKTLVNSHTSCLVLANRVEYLERLTEAYISSGRKGVCLSVLGNSKKAKETRKDALVKLNNGEIDCIFATYQLAAEGLDVPSLNNLILATPEKDERIVTQAVGRVGRKADGKEFGMVYDLVDGFGMFSGWAVKRKGYYKKLGYTYIDIN